MNNIFKNKKTLLERAKRVKVQKQRKSYADNEEYLDEYLDAILAWCNGEIRSKQLAVVVEQDFDVARTSLYSFVFSVLLQGVKEGKVIIKKKKK